MVTPLDVPVLEGSLVRLEPLSMSHAAELATAAEEDRTSYAFTLVPRGADAREIPGRPSLTVDSSRGPAPAATARRHARRGRSGRPGRFTLPATGSR